MSSSLQFTLSRKLMKHGEFYNKELLPFFRSTPKFAVQAYCLRDSQTLYNSITNKDGDFLPLPDVIRENNYNQATFLQQQQQLKFACGGGGSATANTIATSIPSSATASPLSVAMQGLRQLSMWQNRMNMTAQHSFTNTEYQFEVGDVVRHAELDQVGVVAAKLPICFETNDWIMENLGSLTDYRLAHPWYLILVARKDPLPFDFVRYGSQLTHVKGPAQPIGCHRMLPMFFSGFCSHTGRYVPRESHINKLVETSLGVRHYQPTATEITNNNNNNITQSVSVPNQRNQKRVLFTPTSRPISTPVRPLSASSSSSTKKNNNSTVSNNNDNNNSSMAITKASLMMTPPTSKSHNNDIENKKKKTSNYSSSSSSSRSAASATECESKSSSNNNKKKKNDEVVISVRLSRSIKQVTTRRRRLADKKSSSSSSSSSSSNSSRRTSSTKKKVSLS